MIIRYLAPIACIAIAACNGPVTQQQADSFNAQVQSLCGTAMTLAPVAGPVAVDIVAACGTAEVVADLATKPGAVGYLNGILAKIPH